MKSFKAPSSSETRDLSRHRQMTSLTKPTLFLLGILLILVKSSSANIAEPYDDAPCYTATPTRSFASANGTPVQVGGPGPNS